MTSEPTIPRRLLFHALADSLVGQARRLESLTPSRTARRRDWIAGEDAATKRPGRQARAERLRRLAGTIGGWTGDPGRCQGPPVSATDAGLLLALAYGHSEALATLRARHPGRLDGLTMVAMDSLVERILAVENGD